MDRENGNTLWGDSIKKEMAKAKVAYQAHQGVNPHDVRSGKVPSFTGFQEMKCHMIFDVKIDFTRKARFVAGGHMTEAPASLTYSSVVGRTALKSHSY